MAIDHLNPDSLHRNPAFSQGTVIPAGSSIVIVGGQNGVGPDGQIVGDSVGPRRSRRCEISSRSSTRLVPALRT